MQLGALEYLVSLNSSGLDKDIKKSDNKLTKWAVAKGQMISRVMEKAVSSAASSIKGILGGAFQAFADYEQVIGGAELMWGDSFSWIERRAREAYKNVQMSATAYMEQANYYAVGLSEALDGDTQAAAQLADEIITTQADIVAALGIDAERVQSAFSGIMRGNYTMLDNLGLGIAGTKAGMEEVIKKVNEYNKANGIAARYSMKSVADQQKALVEYAKMQGLAGYAAEEGAKTLQGSIASAKAAWTDLLTAMGSGKDVKGATKRFADTVVKVIDNAAPVISRTIDSLISAGKTILPAIKKLFKKLAPQIKKILSNMLTNLWKGMGNIFDRMSGSSNPILQAIGNIGSAIKDLFTGPDGGFKLPTPSELWAKLKPALTKLWEGVQKLAVGVLKFVFGEDENGGIKWPTPEEIWKKIEKGLTALWNGIRELATHVLKLVFGEDEDGGIKWPTAEEIWGKIESGLTALWNGVKNLARSVLKLVFGEDEDGGIKWPTGEEIKEKVKAGLQAMWDGVKRLAGTILKLVFGTGPDGGIKWPTAQELWDKIEQGLDALWSGIKGLAGGILRFVFGETEDGGIKWPTPKELWDKIKAGFEALWDGLKVFLIGAMNWTLKLFGLPSISEMAEAIKKWWEQVKKDVGDLIISIIPKITGVDQGGTPEDQAAGMANAAAQASQNPLGFLMHLIPGFAKGEPTVPYDNFIARLHRGEMVLNASQARRYREGEGDMDYAAVGSMIGSAVEKAMGRVYVMMSGEKVGDLTTRRIRKNLNANSVSKLRALGG